MTLQERIEDRIARLRVYLDDRQKPRRLLPEQEIERKAIVRELEARIDELHRTLRMIEKL